MPAVSGWRQQRFEGLLRDQRVGKRELRCTIGRKCAAAGRYRDRTAVFPSAYSQFRQSSARYVAAEATAAGRDGDRVRGGDVGFKPTIKYRSRHTIPLARIHQAVDGPCAGRGNHEIAADQHIGIRDG